MKEFVFIVTNVLLPIFLQIGIGYLIQKRLQLNISSLTKVQLYVLIPALIFVRIYQSVLEGEFIFRLVIFTAILFVLLFTLSLIASRLFKFSKKKEKAFINAVTLRNQGNYGIPLITLAFSGPYGATAISIHMVVLFTTNLLLNTIGLYNASSGSYSPFEAFKKILKLPMIYAIIFGFLFKGFSINLYGPMESTLDIMADGVVPLALFTLGAQLSETKIHFKDFSLMLAAFGRLILSPLLAYGLTLAFGIDGLLAQVLIVGAAAPTAVNSVLLAIEFEGEAEYASRTVFISTLLSIFTVTLTIQLVQAFVH